MNPTLLILNLEDSEFDAELIQETLVNEDIQCEVLRVETRPEFLEALEQKSFDLILADYSLPGFDGLSALKLACAHCPDTPFIFVTGTMGEEIAVESLKRGATDYVLKQNLARLGHAVRRALRETEDRYERKRTEELLRESEEKFRSLAENSQDYIMRYDRECRHLYENPAALQIAGLSIEDIIGKTHREVGFSEELCDLWEDKITGVFTTGEACRAVFDWQSVEGKVYLDWRLFPEFDQEGNVKTVLGVSRDITEIKQAEEQIKIALAEKETLLRELYHRTKNNMQVIRSMMLLRAASRQSTEINAFVEEIEQKILTMALVHQKLYQSQDLSRIYLDEYVGELAALLIQSYTTASHRIAIRSDLKPVSVLLDTAVPCGLIVNELLSNALKHAFPDGRSGEIRISLCRTPAGMIELYFADNGIGVPPIFDFRAQPTLGLQTLFALVEQQLQGEIVWETQHGVAYAIRFHDNLYTARV